MAYGHTLPMLDIARLFAARGAKATIITTSANASTISATVDRERTTSKRDINIQIIQFPPLVLEDSNSSSSTTTTTTTTTCIYLPQSIHSITSKEMATNFFRALPTVQDPIEQLLIEHHPDCIVADMFFPWVTDVAAKHGVPRLVFHGMSFFALCAMHIVESNAPYYSTNGDIISTPKENLEIIKVDGDDDEENNQEFVLKFLDLPDEIEMKSSQLPDYVLTPSPVKELLAQIKESEVKSYGVLVNSFYDLEPNYVEYYKKNLGRKAWHIGPLALACKKREKPNIDENLCSNWLDQKAPDTVLYVCFGTLAKFQDTQLVEIALALEASQVPFIWVVKTSNHDEHSFSLPEGFEERMESSTQGLIIRGWAPQVLILDHPSVGGFMTHCGWNSVQEGVSAGVPLITWPLIAEQFYNEKLVTEVVRVGVGVGVEKWNAWPEMVECWVGRERIVEAVGRVMGPGEEAVGIRERVRELSVKARKAVGEGGSSFAQFTDLMEGLIVYNR
ncbi:hypothetical protein Scep_000988 [Stephania cephalantha]|uniref:Glycosyltransferase n=1 Tax=Stephania cephalantha TaxID=152367 RepID=A0AAP0L8M3_9MAGN